MFEDDREPASNSPPDDASLSAQHVMLVGSYAPSLLNFRGPLIRDLLAAGHRVSVAAPDFDLETASRLRALGTSVHETRLERTGLGIWADVRYFRRLRALFKGSRPDIILTYTIKPNIWGALAARSVGIRSVSMVTGLGFSFGEGTTLARRLAGFVARPLYRAATRCNDKVVFQNPDDIRDFIAAGCLDDPNKAVMVAGSGVDLSHYTRAPLSPKPVMLLVARLLRSKGVREYAEAAIAVKREMPDVRFLLVGPFDKNPDAIGSAELDDWIREGLEYLGPQVDIRPAMASARIYVLPSYREGTPRSILEAMAMGRPIITADAPGCRETVTDGLNGLLVEPRNKESLRKAMLHLLTDREATEAMANASYHVAREKYDVRKVNRDIIRTMGLDLPPGRGD